VNFKAPPYLPTPSKSKHSGSVDIIPTIPRAPRSRSSLSAPMGDSSLFVMPEAASFFHDVVSKRKFVPARSYQIDALSSEAWTAASQMSEHYHLHPFNTMSGKFNASVIKEFYSNFPTDSKGSNYQIVVRTMPIVLRPSIVNQVLGFALVSIMTSLLLLPLNILLLYLKPWLILILLCHLLLKAFQSSFIYLKFSN
ncbi:unnamed protein product, partial [Prunus brigantina]